MAKTASFKNAPWMRDAWYIACEEKALKKKPLALTLLEEPLVLFRSSSGKVAALEDRCPHRSVPLSKGRVCGENIQCAYHGWQFGGDGVCRLVPALGDKMEAQKARARAYPVREKHGFLWVYMDAEKPPASEPVGFPLREVKSYQFFRYEMDFDAGMVATAENILDVPHTSFLHKGLFRSGKLKPIDVEIRNHADRVEAEFFGEPRPKGIVGSILAPGGGVVRHVDRFILPSLAQVEYALGPYSHLMISNYLSPINRDVTRMFSEIGFRLPVGGGAVKRIVMPLAKRIADQDYDILAAQQETIEKFGEERLFSTSADVLGPRILQLLKRASKADSKPLRRTNQKLTMYV
ncbi:MAG: aromatic ring-hydroxylating dioxygenase subunit alpha [Myxococcota bacterium]|nr:aromatic ring-hydroxylating dioxygenase subunit alpha [Myxococcota bacterium]